MYKISIYPMLCISVLLGCRPQPDRSPEAAAFHRTIIEFVEAAGRGDSARLAELSFDEQAIRDAETLRRIAPRVTRNPRTRLGQPYHLTIHGDTAVVFLLARETEQEEFGTEFRRVGPDWHVVRIGFSPR